MPSNSAARIFCVSFFRYSDGFCSFDRSTLPSLSAVALDVSASTIDWLFILCDQLCRTCGSTVSLNVSLSNASILVSTSDSITSNRLLFRLSNKRTTFPNWDGSSRLKLTCFPFAFKARRMFSFIKEIRCFLPSDLTGA